VSVPAIQTDVEIRVRNLKQYETQEAYGGGGYKRGNNDRHLFVIARYDVDHHTNKGSSRNSPRDKDNVCANNWHPIHVRRFPKRINTFKPVDNAECHSNGIVSSEPQYETCRNRDDPSEYINC
jgi:hypothetical protein